jgi:hypothetical protein
MKWACIVIILLFLPVVIAQDDANPFLTQGQATQVSIDMTTLESIFTGFRDTLAKQINDNNDQNYRTFDAIIKNYLLDTQKKAIIGIIGINALVAGFFFYFMNKRNKDLNYESVALKRRKDDEDRKYLVENINYIRERLDYLEEEARRKFDSYVMPTAALDDRIAKERSGGNFDGTRGYDAAQEANYAYPVERGTTEGAYSTDGSQAYGGYSSQGRAPEERYV